MIKSLQNWSNQSNRLNNFNNPILNQLLRPPFFMKRKTVNQKFFQTSKNNIKSPISSTHKTIHTPFSAYSKKCPASISIDPIPTPSLSLLSKCFIPSFKPYFLTFLTKKLDKTIKAKNIVIKKTSKTTWRSTFSLSSKNNTKSSPAFTNFSKPSKAPFLRKRFHKRIWIFNDQNHYKILP